MAASVTDLLVREGLITPDQLAAAQSMARTMGEPVLSVLVEQGAVAKRDVVRFTVEAAGMEFVNVLDIDVDPAALTCLTGDQARLYQALPIGFDGETLVVVCDAQTATNRQVVQDLLAITRHPVRFSCALKSEIQQRLAIEYPPEELAPEQDDADAVVLDAADPVAIAPAREYVDALMSYAMSTGATDIHLETTGSVARIRVRLDGLLVDARQPPRALQPAVIHRVKRLAGLVPQERDRPQHGKFTFRNDGRAITLRVNTVPTMAGEEIVCHVAPAVPMPLGLDDLGFSDEPLAAWRAAITRQTGLIVVSGPPGSGRSTLLTASLTAIARTELSMVTVEAHVETRIPGSTPVRVDEEAGFGYSAALDALREADPDVVLIGEITDASTIRRAVDFALTRSLVFTTVPSADATTVIGRLIGMGVEPFLLRSALACTVSQRVVRRLCSACRRPIDVPTGSVQGDGIPHWALASCFEAVGCPSCTQTGYHGRTALHEVMPMTHELGGLVMRGADVDEIRGTARRAGMRTMREDGWLKVSQGLTTVEEVLRAVG